MIDNLNLLLQAYASMVYDRIGIVANVGRDGDEYFVIWWEDGDYNCLSVYDDDDQTAHFTQHHDGKLIAEWEGVASSYRGDVLLEWWVNDTPFAFDVHTDTDTWYLLEYEDDITDFATTLMTGSF